MATLHRPAIFLDRDGTINVDTHYLHRPEDWEWMPGAIDSIKAFHEAGYLVIVVSNQSGIARGLYTAAQVDALHAHVNQLLAEQGTTIDGYYYCPHHPDFGPGCDCRKPLPGLLFAAQNDLSIDLSRSWMIGDKISDIRAAQAAGVRPILVTGDQNEAAALEKNIALMPELSAARAYILAQAD